MKTFHQWLKTKTESTINIPPGAKVCGNCNGQGSMYVTPYKVSPPSLHRKNDGGYDGNSNIKRKIYVKCDACNGKGYLSPSTP